MSKNIIIGLGTGRCGTKSLTTLLQRQPATRATHEVKPVLPWVLDLVGIERRLCQLIGSDSEYVEDVAYYYLPYIEWLRDWGRFYNANMRFVCLQRDKQATVNSYLEHTSGRNHWCWHDGTKWELDSTWDKTYPKYDITDKREAVERYYDEYYALAKQLERSDFKIFSIDSLNTLEGVAGILDFIGFKDRAEYVGIRKNVRVCKIKWL